METRYYKRLTPPRDFFGELPEYYCAHLSLRQWRLIVSILSSMDDEEAQNLAKDLMMYVLPDLGPG